MRVKYTGPVKNLVLRRRDLEKVYDFSKGICNGVTNTDTAKLLLWNPEVFSIVKVKKAKKTTKKLPDKDVKTFGASLTRKRSF